MKIYSQILDWQPDSFPHDRFDNVPVFAMITMENDCGMKVRVLNYGCILHRMEVPDKDDRPRNVILSLPSPTDYFNNPAYINALIGRTAGRIGDGSFSLNDKIYTLNKNYKTTSAHGGNIGFDKKFFDFTLQETKDEVGVRFSLRSSDMEEGYPGNVSLRVNYSLNRHNEFSITYEATSDADTLLNLTNHTYFNLHADIDRDILSHRLHLRSNHYTPILDNGVVRGTIEPVQDTPFDFRKPKQIGKDIETDHPQIRAGSGYDHFFFFDKNLPTGVPKLSLSETSSGILLELLTDADGSVLYTQNFPISNIPATENVLPIRHCIAIEPSASPIGRSGEFIVASILRQNEIYRRSIRYRFQKISKNI